MFNCNLIVLSYHSFTETPSDYQFSRTYKQFRVDLRQKDYDWITIDDGYKNIIHACDILRENNVRAKIFISTGLVATEKYCTWDDIGRIALYHDIENHSHFHKRLTWLTQVDIEENIRMASELIKVHTGRMPRYFAPPFNTSNKNIETIAGIHGMTLVRNRIEILNSTP